MMMMQGQAATARFSPALQPELGDKSGVPKLACPVSEAARWVFGAVAAVTQLVTGCRSTAVVAVCCALIVGASVVGALNVGALVAGVLVVGALVEGAEPESSEC